MNLLPRDRLIAAIAQTVIFFGLVRWLLSVMAEACCFKAIPTSHDYKDVLE